MKRTCIKTALVSLLVFSVIAALFATAAYGGVETDSKKPMEALFEMELMAQHQPKDTVTRYEAVSALLGVMAELHLIDENEPDAGILDSKDEYLPVLSRAANIGILKGDCTGFVAPMRSVSLTEMLTMCLRALGYADVTSSNVYELAESAKLYIHTEYDDLYFFLTADKMAEILWNMLTADRGEGATFIEELINLELVAYEVYEELLEVIGYEFGDTSGVPTGGAAENDGGGTTVTESVETSTPDSSESDFESGSESVPDSSETVAPPESDTTVPAPDTTEPPESESEEETTTQKPTTTKPAVTENDDGWGPIWRP